MKVHLDCSYLVLVVFILVKNSAKVFTQSTSNALVSQFQRREVLDSNIGLALEWSVNRDSNVITLQVEIQHGIPNFALGLTRKGNIEGADVMYFEVDPENGNNTPIVSDMYGVDNRTIIQDGQHNLQFFQSSSAIDRIFIQIQRNLDTCDDQDMKIDESLIQVVWDYGKNSTLPSNFEVRGIKRIYFTDTNVYSNSNLQDLQQGRISRRLRIPPRHTSYWCSIHKLNVSLTTKHHIVGFSNYIKDKETRKNVHHQLIYRCTAPPGVNPTLIFEKFVNHPGEECYLQDAPQLPALLCREMMLVWAIGGEPFILPDTIGIPIGENINEYFMLESHYDNPEVRSDLEIENGIDFEYTSQLRQDDGSLMYTGYGIPGLFAIPPESSSFNIVGHCSSYCTKEMLPSTGVQIHSLTLHAHTQARRMRLRHFRGNQELKWIINDDNYDYNYQVVRTLPEPVTILPGDQLTTECSFDNTGRNNSASSSGYSTKDEMCTTFYVINKKIPYLLCSSEYPADTFMSRFGIQSLTWNVEKYERIVNSAKNSSIVGLTMGEVVGNWSSWSTEERVTWERELMYGKHNANCPNVRFFGAAGYPYIALLQTLNITAPFNDPDSFIGTPFPSGSVTYPVGATTYTPPNTCRNGEFATNGNVNPSSIGVGVTGIPNAPIVTAGRLGFGSVVPSTIQNPPAVSVMRNTLSPPPPPLFR